METETATAAIRSTNKGASFDASTVLKIIFDIIRRCETIGISIDCVTSDMGAGNQVIWKLCGIVATRYGRPKTTCAHPCDRERDLSFLADAPHLLTNLRGHLIRQQKVQLGTKTVSKYGLRRSEVRLFTHPHTHNPDINHALINF
ncbi:hypothetical protein HPB52_007992 [Rhipicephalus sanguineus]|uniref:Transposable element P transposase n=1 Tax=Rhipicephalus sanguineus TaxID=34632 RepID=A0A9D4Q5F2_RHISA|nr:hypothetical protein HPB52_007992 [Rhipicephalus sanguineus]